MLSSAVRHFADPDDFADSVRAAAAQHTALGRGPFTAKLTRIDLHDLWMQRFEESVANAASVAIFPGRAIIELGATEQTETVESGVELSADTLYQFAESQVALQHSPGPARLAVMSLPIERLARAGAVLAGAELRPPADGTGLRPPPSALARLRRLHAEAGRLAEQQPGIIADPHAAMALEQELIRAMIACLAEGENRGDSAANRHHGRIMRRFHELIAESPDERMHILEVCTQLNVSDRTLRACCQEYLGMSPHRYLWMRQMTMARRALLRAEPASTTVTDIATANGFWELGRFAVGYKQLFGESPSASLRRPPRP